MEYWEGGVTAMMKRIIDKQTNLFLRDDFSHNEETELALDVTPAQGLFRPRWDGTQWVEDMTAEEIQATKDAAIPTEPTLEEKVVEHDSKIVTMEEALEALFGGV